VSPQLVIPDHVSETNRQRILELAQESPREVSQVECCEYLIRHWCEAVEDGNPLYLDEAYARSRGFRGLVAQPGMLICTLTLPYRWPWPEGYRSQRLIHFQLKELLELPVGILARYEKWFHAPVQVGDRLSSTVRLLEISPWKRTRLGEGCFTTIETRYYNQDGLVVAHSYTHLFSYGGRHGMDDEPRDGEATALTPEPMQPAAASTIEEPAPADPPGGDAIRGGWHDATEECLESWRTGWRPKPPAELHWEEVSVGDELPGFALPVAGLFGVVRCDHVWMRQLGGRLDFAVESIHGFGLPHQLAIDDFHRHRAIHHAVSRLEDIAHAAVANQAENLITRMGCSPAEAHFGG